ncbi:peptidase dimerization domain-containing protein [Nonomuraea sp. NPDC049400]|uniref:peptidase dimerization domain-containing protein n=1 Tax=Nonomuraea sp. NPDC049400 TaxID=3364352 RepID=UPI0037B3D22E
MPPQGIIARPVERYAAEMASRPTSYPMNPDDAPGTMLVVGGLSGGGSNFNVVPGSAYFTVDGRYNPEEDLDGELKRLTDLIEDAAREIGAGVSVQTVQLQPSAGTDQEHPAAAALARVVSEVQGTPARFEMCAGIPRFAGTRNSAFPPSATARAAWTSPMGPTSTSTRPPCAAVYALYAGDLLT